MMWLCDLEVLMRAFKTITVTFKPPSQHHAKRSFIYLNILKKKNI